MRIIDEDDDEGGKRLIRLMMIYFDLGARVITPSRAACARAGEYGAPGHHMMMPMARLGYYNFRSIMSH